MQRIEAIGKDDLSMLMQEDNTFNEIREKSIRQWLLEMSTHEDVAVRGGVKVTTDYLDALKKKIQQLEEKNQLKDEYLKKMRAKLRESATRN